MERGFRLKQDLERLFFLNRLDHNDLQGFLNGYPAARVRAVDLLSGWWGCRYVEVRLGSDPVCNLKNVAGGLFNEAGSRVMIARLNERGRPDGWISGRWNL